MPIAVTPIFGPVHIIPATPVGMAKSSCICQKGYHVGWERHFQFTATANAGDTRKLWLEQNFTILSEYYDVNGQLVGWFTKLITEQFSIDKRTGLTSFDYHFAAHLWSDQPGGVCHVKSTVSGFLRIGQLMDAKGAPVGDGRGSKESTDQVSTNKPGTVSGRVYQGTYRKESEITEDAKTNELDPDFPPDIDTDKSPPPTDNLTFAPDNSYPPHVYSYKTGAKHCTAAEISDARKNPRGKLVSSPVTEEHGVGPPGTGKRRLGKKRWEPWRNNPPYGEGFQPAGPVPRDWWTPTTPDAGSRDYRFDYPREEGAEFLRNYLASRVLLSNSPMRSTRDPSSQGSDDW